MGGTTGPATVTGTTGTGTKFSAYVNINSSGVMDTVFAITVPGSYSVNPSVTAEPVTGGGLTGAKLSLLIGPNTITISNAGVYTTNPGGGVLTQYTTSGSGSGAQFQNAVFGVQAVTVSRAGSYTAQPSNPVSQASTTGYGYGATFTVSWGSSAPFATGDWIYFSGVGGMTQLNGLTLVATNLGGGVYSFSNVYGTAIDATTWGSWTSGGTGSRIYTYSSPYAESDLKWLKWAESADVMSIACVNKDTGTEYPIYDLARYADNHWVFTQVTMAPTISAPGSCWLNGTVNWSFIEYSLTKGQYIPSLATYQYVVTSVNPLDGTESVASPIGQLAGAVDISQVAGSITITWSPVTGAQQYNIYKATPISMAGFGPPAAPQVGALFGFAGTAFGTQFIDNNIVADFAQTPPIHKNPFARGQIVGVAVTNGGSGYNTATATITTSTGSNAKIICIVIGGAVVGYLISDNGGGYSSSDTITISGDGSGATATLIFGAFSGTYPSVVSYLQQRRIYASTINNPDTYWMSTPGSFTNFDSRIPTIDSDAISGTPWGQQVNGIQWFVPFPGGTVAMTGNGSWFVGGQGSSSFSPQPITPAGQQALPQSFNGCSPTVPPIRIDYDVIFLQAMGSRYRDLSVQYFTNIMTGVDICLTSDHLFLGNRIVDHAWCEEPYKLLWSVRDDGVLLSLTYYKAQEVLGWARHDTYGRFKSVCSIIEPPVNALYLAVERQFGSDCYVIERMDNRIWTDGVESVWCVDCGLSYPQPAPAATLYANSTAGLGSCTGVSGLIGGTGYSSGTAAVVVDNNGRGPGYGAVVSLTISDGVITGISFSSGGGGYTAPALVFSDPAGSGSGASATVTLNNQVMFTASSAVFSVGDIGSVVRVGGGIATITGYTSSTQVTADLTQPITTVTFNQGIGYAAYADPGSWTKTAPVSAVSGLYHLAGIAVSYLADGNPYTGTVSSIGTLTLAAPASAITVGLGFTAQLQSVYLDVGNPTVQGQRKKIGAATIRVESSRGFTVGSNQVDGSTMNPIQIAPTWSRMAAAKDLGVPAYQQGVVPLWTGDTRVAVSNDLGKPAQIAIQQTLPLPLNVTAIVNEVLGGDTPSQEAPKRQPQGARQ